MVNWIGTWLTRKIADLGKRVKSVYLQIWSDISDNFKTTWYSTVEINWRLWFAKNNNGNIIIQCIYDEAKDYTGEGFFAVKRAWNRGYINKKGEQAELIWCDNFDFDDALSFENWYGKVKKDWKRWAVALDWIMVIDCEYTDITTRLVDWNIIAFCTKEDGSVEEQPMFWNNEEFHYSDKI